MSNKRIKTVASFDPGSDCTIRNSRALIESLIELVNSGSGAEIDCTAVQQTDLTFVQTIVSAERSFAARDLPFVMLAVPDGVRSAFARAGVALPGAGSL